MRVPGIRYDRPVQSLALSDVGGAARVGRAEAQSMVQMGQAKQAQMLTATAIKRLELEGELAFQQGELDAWKFKQQMKAYDRAMIASALQGAAALTRLGATLYEWKVGNEEADATNKYNEIMSQGLPQIQSEPYRIEQEKPNATPQTVSNSDVLVDRFNLLHDSAIEQAMAGVKTKGAKQNLERRFEAQGIAGRGKMIELALDWKKQDALVQYDKNMNTYLQAGDWDGAKNFLKWGVGSNIVRIGSRVYNTYDSAIESGKAFSLVDANIQRIGEQPDPGMAARALGDDIMAGKYPQIAPQKRADALKMIDAKLTETYTNRLDSVLTVTKGAKLGDLPTAKQELQRFINTPYKELGYSDAASKNLAVARLQAMINDRETTTTGGYRTALLENGAGAYQEGVAIPSRGITTKTAAGKTIEVSQQDIVNAGYDRDLAAVEAGEIPMERLVKNLIKQYRLPSNFVNDRTDDLKSGNPARIMFSVSMLKTLRQQGGGGIVHEAVDGMETPEKSLYYLLDRQTERNPDQEVIARTIQKHQEMKDSSPDEFDARSDAWTKVAPDEKQLMLAKFLETEQGVDLSEVVLTGRSGVAYQDYLNNAARFAPYSSTSEEAAYQGYRMTMDDYAVVTRFGAVELMKNQPESRANSPEEVQFINDDFEKTWRMSGNDMELAEGAHPILTPKEEWMKASDGKVYEVYVFTDANHQPVMNQRGEQAGQRTRWWAALPEMQGMIDIRKAEQAFNKNLEHRAGEEAFDRIDGYLRSKGYRASTLMDNPDLLNTPLDMDNRSWLKENFIPLRTFSKRDPTMETPIPEDDQVYKDTLRASQILWEDAVEFARQGYMEDDLGGAALRQLSRDAARAWETIKSNIRWQRLRELREEASSRNQYEYPEAIN